MKEGNRVIITAPAGTSYQWKKDAVDLGDDAPRLTGSTTQTLTFNTVLQSDAGVYTVVYDDGSKTLVQTAQFNMSVLPATPKLPVAGGIAVGLLTMGLLAIGVRRSRRKD